MAKARPRQDRADMDLTDEELSAAITSAKDEMSRAIAAQDASRREHEEITRQMRARWRRLCDLRVDRTRARDAAREERRLSSQASV